MSHAAAFHVAPGGARHETHVRFDLSGGVRRRGTEALFAITHGSESVRQVTTLAPTDAWAEHGAAVASRVQREDWGGRVVHETSQEVWNKKMPGTDKFIIAGHHVSITVIIA